MSLVVLLSVLRDHLFQLPFASLQVSQSSDVSVSDAMFNPAAEFAHLLPVVLSDGSLSMLQVASTAECVGRLAASEKITCRALKTCQLEP